MKRNIIKKISVILLVIYLIFICASCEDDDERRANLAKICSDSQYVVLNNSCVRQGEKCVYLSSVMVKKAIELGIRRADTDTYCHSIIIGDKAFLRVRVDENAYVYGKWSVDNPFDIEFLEYSTGKSRSFFKGEIAGKTYIFSNTTRTLIFYDVETWEKYCIPVPADCSANFYKGRPYFYRNTDCAYLLIDKNFNLVEALMGSSLNEIINYLGDDYVYFYNNGWYKIEGMVKVADDALIQELEIQAEKLKKKDKVTNSFIYKGKTYEWENVFDEYFSRKAEKQTTLLVKNVETEEEYSFSYGEFAELEPELYAIYPSLYCYNAFVQNGELFFIYWYEGEMFRYLDSEMIVFKYNEKTNILEYVGFCTNEDDIYVGKASNLNKGS